MKEKTIAFVLIALCSLAVLVALFKPSVNIKSNTSNVLSSDSEILKKALGSKIIKVIPLEGVIYDSYSSSSPFRTDFNAAFLRKHLRKALRDNSTKAVLLRVNSPGGTVATSQEIYKLVLSLREAGKPVVVSISDVCASGCYYIASAADRIIANKGSLTGSIGVISQGLNYKGLFDKLGLRDQTFKAGKFKDMGNGARELNPEETKIYQALIDNSYKQFLEDIHFGRGIEMEKLEKIAQGLIYTGEQALDVNLVDELGTYDDAKLATLALLKKAGNTDIESYSFDELWDKNRIDSIEDLLDMNPFGAISKFNLNALFQKYGFSQSDDQIMWLSR
jgi:protease IV